MASITGSFSSWLQGRPCHEEECKAKGTFECPWKGCKAKELPARIETFLEELEECRHNLHGCDSVARQACITRMLAFATVKFEWVNDLPYFLWQVDSPDMADKFLQKYDSQTEKSHRVSDRFGMGPLREDMEVWARDKTLSVRLAIELMAYRACMLDDTWSEASHRDISHEKQRTTCASAAWRCASARHGQHLREWSACTASERKVFAKLWRRWKAIAQVNVQKAKRHVIKRMKDRAVTAFVYRTDMEGLYDWTRVLAHCLDAHKSSARQGPRLGLSSLQKIDFLAKTVLEGHVYSVPLLDTNNTDDMLGRLTLQDADEALYTAMDRIVFFTLVESHLRRTKGVITETARARKHMWMPSCVQYYHGEHTDDGLWHLSPTGRPSVTDLIEVASWDVLRGGLRIWETMATVTDGHITVQDHEPISMREWSMAAVDTPAIIVAEHLHRQGWKRGKTPQVHTAISPRLYMCKSILSQKAYLQCLAILDALFERGLPQLVTRKPMAYYKCLLSADNLASVPVFDTAQQYKALEHGEAHCVGTAIENGDERESLVVHGDIAEYVPSLTFEEPPAPHAAASSSTRETTDNEGTAFYIHGFQSHGAQESGLAPVEVATGGMDSEARTHGQDGPHGLQVVSETADAADNSSLPRTKQRKRGHIVDAGELAGCSLKLEIWGSPEYRDHYKRYIAVCPFHSTETVKCWRKRNCGPGQTRLLGESEPKAFLGAWLCRAPLSVTREDHMEEKTTNQHVKDYARRNGML